MSGYETKNTPTMTPFMARAQEDLRALQANHQKRRFYKDRVQSFITALEEAMSEAQIDGFDDLLYLHYRDMSTSLRGRSSIDGVQAIFDARLQKIDRGALTLKRRPKKSELEEENEALKTFNEALKVSNAHLNALLEQNKVHHEAAMNELKRQHQEVIGKLNNNPTAQNILQLVDARVAQAMREREERAQEAAKEQDAFVASLQATIKKQDTYIASLEAEKKTKSEENQDNRQGQFSPRFHKPACALPA
jgi:hypothetical protein